MTTARITAPFAAKPAATRAPEHDVLGLRAGWRAYTVWRDLSELTDGQLAARGLTRADIPALALREIKRKV
ncbi:MAG: hypothetical protein IE927_01470 [Rhodobacterales bacterium]|nr:hypothetical protein [Rhodobacterales bacterium]